MKKIFFQAAIAAIFLSCASLTPDSIAGTYTGIIPCADCEGIETVITLTSDNRYTIRWRYLGKEPENLFEDSGTFSFDPNVNVITLKDIEPHSGPS
ncbi:MAG: copper resistance protein NlpE, partial [Spirochaetales bacterium]|nr:copper resistance protein NlpE [Spirochaetales bacterium]